MKTKTKKKSGKPKKRFRLAKKVRDDIREAAVRKQIKNNFDIDKTTLIHLYWHVGLTQEQIGDIFGITRQCVSHKMHDMKISVRKGRQITASSKPKQQHKRNRNKKLKVHKVKTKLPNTYEQKIIDLCAKKCYPFTFVGNKCAVVEDKSPDFISSDDAKRIIEVYSTHWHRDDYEITRGKFFRDRDYEILFLSDEDVNVDNWEEICNTKIENFIKVKDK